MSDFVRDAVLTGLKAPIVRGYAQTLDEQKMQFTTEEKGAVKQLRESEVFKLYPKQDLDRHEIKFLMGRVCTFPVSVLERAASKVEYCMDIKLLDENLIWNRDLAAEMAGVTLNEGMASTASDDTQVKDQGMYGLGNGADKPEPKSQADSGSSQKSDRGDHKHTADKGDGYMSEEEAKEAVAALEARHAEERAALEGKMPPQFDKNKIPAGSDADGDGKKNEPPIFQKGEKKEAEDDDMTFPKKKEEAVAKDQAPKANMAPSPTNDSNTAATDARYNHGAKQNESMEEMEARHAAERAALEASVAENTYGNEGKAHTTADPKASQPGTGDSGSKGQKGTEDGEVPKTPNYAKAGEEDPSNSPTNKGPAQARNESFEDVEARVCEILEGKGYERGTAQWKRAYQRAFDMWLHERAEQSVEAGNQDQ